VLVTDPGGSLADGAALRAAIRAVTTKPITHVLLSHVHPDHIFGAGAFIADKPIFLGHANLPQALAARGAFYQNALNHILGPGQAGPVVAPTQTISTSTEIDLGNRRLTLRAHKPAHTATDVSLFDHQTGTLLAADLLFVRRAPSLDGSLSGWIDQLAVLGGLRPARVVPGHGPVCLDFAAAAAPLLRYLTLLRRETRAAVAANIGMEAASMRVAQGERANWVLFDDYNPRNVLAAYKELEWE
jgi:quinoprotein relay system zinc metallohydrolase 2